MLFLHKFDGCCPLFFLSKIWLCAEEVRTGLFANLKRLGGQNGLPPNLAISSQMTMKLGKDITWEEIFID